ncbi:MAG: AAA family ATPase [Candidatus Nanoarchaeia archaeon]
MSSTPLNFKDVAGLQMQKNVLYDSLILPQKHKDIYEQLVKEPNKIPHRNNFLFYGPPGTGKTLLAKALASEMDCTYIASQSTQFLQEYVGKGAKSLRELYTKTKGIIFIDEIDIIASKRNYSSKNTQDIVVQLLLMLDSVDASKDVTTICATNNKEHLDDAFLSRIPLAHQLYFGLPNAQQREAIIKKKLSYFSSEISCVDSLVKATESYDARVLEDIIIQASRNALKNKSPIITNDHIQQAKEVFLYDK